MSNLPPIGARVWYTGDRADIEGWCVVAGHNPATNYSAAGVDLTMEDGRNWRNVTPSQWKISPGRRFIVEAEYREQQAAAMARMEHVIGPFKASRPGYPSMIGNDF